MSFRPPCGPNGFALPILLLSSVNEEFPCHYLRRLLLIAGSYPYEADITVKSMCIFMLHKRKSKNLSGWGTGLGSYQCYPRPPGCHGRGHAPSRTHIHL